MSQFDIDQYVFAGVVFGFQGLLVILYRLFTEYATDNVAFPEEFTGSQNTTVFYPMFQDVHVMMFLGFGFLMTFLKRYGYSSIGFNFLVSVFSLQWGILTINFFHKASEGDWSKIPISTESLINGDYSAAAVLISLGAVLGKTTPLQTVIFVIFELIFYGASRMVILDQLDALDMGGSIYIHTFGAYFGLTLSMILSPQEVKGEKHPLEGSVSHSDLFSMIGTVFLWMYWPSFNAGDAPWDQQERTVVNTVIALCASCATAFAASAVLRSNHQLDMVDIQNATLAGGVAVGASSNLEIEIWGAMVLGGVAGILSVVGYVFIQPFLLREIGLHDTCGVHNLHGMPGVLGGIASAVTVAVRDSHPYMTNHNRTGGEQAAFQLLAIANAIGFGVVGGVITGLLLNVEFLFKKQRKPFDDSEYFATPVEVHASDPVLEEVSINEEHMERSPLIKHIV